MPEESEMEILVERLTDGFGHDIMKNEGGVCYDRKQTESVPVMGALAERGGSDSMDCKDFLED